MRLTINVNPDHAVEAALWKDLSQRRDQLYRQLLLLAAGHPSQEVATAANELSTALLWAAQHSQIAAIEVLAGRHNTKLIEDARERHATADVAAEKLAAAVKDAVVPKCRLFGKTRRGEVYDLGQSSSSQSTSASKP
jgi:hypothetical protein